MDIEEFQNEILAAESYLQQRSSASEQLQLSNNKRLSILEKFGRNPIQRTSVDVKNEAIPSIPSIFRNSTTDSIVERDNNNSKEKENNRNVSNTNRYADPEMRNQLINRLLTEHKLKKESKLAETPEPQASSSNSGSMEDNDEVNYHDDDDDDENTYTAINQPRVQENLVLSQQAPVNKSKRVAVDKNLDHQRSRSKSPTATVTIVSQRIHQMQAQHEMKLQNREKLKSEYERQKEMECTFTPTLSRGSRNIIQQKQQEPRQQQQKQSTTTAPSSLSPSRDKIFDRLYAEADHRILQHRQLERSLTQERLSDCTFHPNTMDSKRSVSATRRRQRSSSQERSMNIDTRIFSTEVNNGNDDDIPLRMSTSADVATSMRQSLMTVKTGEMTSTLPIYERVSELQKQRVLRMRELSEATEAQRNQSVTFTPKINAVRSSSGKTTRMSRRLAEKRGIIVSSSSSSYADSESQLHVVTAVEPVHLDVASRLTFEGKLAAQRKKQLQQEIAREESVHYTPQPLSKGTQALAKSNPVVRASFDERQLLYRAQAMNKELMRRNQENRINQLLFKPMVTSVSAAILASSQPERLTETAAQRAERLAHAPGKEKQKEIKEKTKELYGRYAYQPSINSLSRALVGPRPSSVTARVAELSADPRRQRAREQARLKVEEQYKAECSFQPKITDYPLFRNSNRRNNSHSPSKSPHKLHKEQQEGINLSTSGSSNRRGSSNVWDAWAAANDDVYNRDSNTLRSSSSSSSSRWADCPVDIYNTEQTFRQSHSNQSTVMQSHSRTGINSIGGSSGTSYPIRTYINITEPDKMSRDYYQREIEKEERRREQLIAREIEELRVCTFHPKIPPAPPSTLTSANGIAYTAAAADNDMSTTHNKPLPPQQQSPVIVRGLGRYLELQMMSQLKKQETAERQRLAFTVNIKNIERLKRPEDGTTIPKPFHFSSLNLSGRESRAVAASVAREENELTFVPKRGPALPVYQYEDITRLNRNMAMAEKMVNQYSDEMERDVIDGISNNKTSGTTRNSHSTMSDSTALRLYR